jgi:hypothetical protein
MTSLWATKAVDRRAPALDLRAPPGRRCLVPHHAHPGAWRKENGGPVACDTEQLNTSLVENVTVK